MILEQYGLHMIIKESDAADYLIEKLTSESGTGDTLMTGMVYANKKTNCQKKAA
jgi:hypothetical protein